MSPLVNIANEKLSRFFEQIREDPRIGTTHIALYATLLAYGKRKGFVVPLLVFSWEIIPLAKMSSTKTYFKTLKELSNYGYLKYEASFNRLKGSKIYL